MTTIPSFVLQPSEAESLTQSLNLPSTRRLLPHLVAGAQPLARPPISHFHVAAVGLGSDGRVFVGVNLEFPNLPLHHSVHAEQFLLTNLLLHQCPELVAFAVSAPPCGHCRQFLQELRHADRLKIHIINKDDSFLLNKDQSFSDGDDREEDPAGFVPLSNFLPEPFGPSDLLHEGTPLLLEKRDNGLCLLNDQEEDVKDCIGGNNGDCEKLIGFSNGDVKLVNGNHGKLDSKSTLMRDEALKAANNSHAPYSNCPSGVSLMDCEGKVYRGSYMESAAYNPSLGPVQAALVAYVAAGGSSYNRIVAAVLVEKEEAKVRQEGTARLLLDAVSPKCELKVYYAKEWCEKVLV